jgi:4,5-dihydroxyphthalate decarboxylase
MALRTVSRTQGNNRALKDGLVRPAHFELEFEEIPVLVNAFRRMVRGLEFDVCEMAITTYMCAKEHGTAFTALPIFLVRGFHHGAIQVNRSAGITSPKDLEGRRVGVNRGYTVTTGVWARGILASEYGVDLGAVTWVLSGDEHVADYRPPANVVPIEAGRTLAEMLSMGELDAAIGADVNHPDVVPLLDVDAGFEALRSRGLYPINHLIVVKDELLATHPDLAVDLFAAFSESKDRYVKELPTMAAPTPVDLMHRRVMEITGSDPLPYGVEANRAMLDELISHALEQHILTSAPSLSNLFVGTD